ncbi:polysaccharide pyruvyl transferase family protein [Bacillus thuringiensis]|uniref:polysaccharide pyruvyl transferase family protein n=1 Tax=Bacillus thuringiensis TaxID=1428 RepID=UPI0010AC1FB7|nr:polysaccharide pyruvyl transferase family protein [Bacillus thuringiensis]TKA00365.1 polysaccharide pyruvyl transferase family protein [Bacillus thuringiensis]
MILLYLGYLGTNNIGDEVCYEAFQQSLRQWSKKKHKIISFPLYEKKSLQEFYKDTPFDIVILGGGSLLQGNLFLTLIEEAHKMNIPVFGYGTGIDYLTEQSIYNYQQQKNIETNQFFDNRDVDLEKVTKIIKSIKFIGVRGPLTYHSLLTYDPGLTNVDIIGDAAITYTPKQDFYIIEKYLPKKVNKIVAVNWGTTLNKLFGYNEIELSKQLTECCEFLQHKGYHVVIFPMWDVDITYCQNLYSNLYKSNSITIIPEVCTSTQIYSLLEKSEFSINLKLHANVLSAAALTPFINLAYRSKGMDFSYSLECQENTVLTNTNNLLDHIIEREHVINNNRAQFSDNLCKYKKHYIQKQQTFFNKHLLL